ncbi:MAG: carboxypeptidase regulatory-like domain-containing protein [Acidobacteria bacterium]|nr:carboxypeptidase regulatory-like domain-containing protein [Acidobacteriota bacterium]
MIGKNFVSKIGLSLISLFVLMSLSVGAFAQLTRGTIAGTVRDNSGAVINGATLVVTNTATNISRTVTTDENGFYRVAGLEPGDYTVTIEKTGFEKIETRNVIVRTAQETTYDPQLKVGAITDVVVISGSQEFLELNKTNPTIGLTTTARQAVELPLSAGRNINNLAVLSPNAFRGPGSSGISVNGQRARNNNFTIDGSDNNDISVTISTSTVIPEAVQEFQVQTNPFSVEFGRNSGAQINVITKSGTNDFHAEAFEYYSGSALNALNTIEKRNGLLRPARINRNQAGGAVGGALIKDRVFYFGSIQADRTRTGATPGPNVRIPTQAGFAALSTVPLRAASGNTPAQSQASRQAVLNALSFLNNIYGQNPTFSNLRNDTINGVAIQTGTTNVPIIQPINNWNWLAKVDAKLSEKDNITFRYLYDKPVSVNVISNTQFGSLFSGNQNILDQNAQISETHVFKPTLLNEFRISYIRRNLQFPENDPTSATTNIGGFFTIGGAANFPQGRIQNSYQLSDTLSWQLGKHSLKFGLDYRHIRLFNEAAFNIKGVFNFNNLANYLNNVAASYQQALQVASFDARQNQQFYFVNDEFRIKPNFTLNLGLRYEYSDTPFGFFGATDAQSLAALVPGPVYKDKNNFAPGIGFAWSPRPRGGFLKTLLGEGATAIRGGYRIGYDVLFYNILTVNASNFPRVVTADVQNQIDVFPNRLTVNASPVFNPLATYVNSPERSVNPKAQSFSFTIQRQFLNDFVVEVGYAGSRGLHGINQLQANPGVLTAAQIATVQQTKDFTSIPALQARRVFPQFGSRTLIATTAQSTYHSGFVSLNKRLSNRLQFTSSYTWSKNMSNNDESLGVGAITAGSPQVPQDFFNINAEKSLSAFDRTHRIAASWLYEVPWFKYSWAQNGFVKRVFDGWQLSGIAEAQSGQPFTILTGVDTNGNGAGGDRPNFNPSGAFTVDPITGNLRTFTNDRLTGRYIVPVVGANGLPIQNSIGNGNLGRNTLRGQGFVNWNMSLLKRIKVMEDVFVTLRADALNVFNQKYFGNPNNNMNSLDFGRNLNDGGNRSLILGAKLSF